MSEKIPLHVLQMLGAAAERISSLEAQLAAAQIPAPVAAAESITLNPAQTGPSYLSAMPLDHACQHVLRYADAIDPFTCKDHPDNLTMMCAAQALRLMASLVTDQSACGVRMDVISRAYGWTIDVHGEVNGLIAGDMGYEPTGIKLTGDDLQAWKLAVAMMSAEALEPAYGDLLPPIGSTVEIHLNSLDKWVEHTVTGYYVWKALSHQVKGDPDQCDAYRVFVRVADANGCENARLLSGVRLISTNKESADHE